MSFRDLSSLDTEWYVLAPIKGSFDVLAGLRELQDHSQDARPLVGWQGKQELVYVLG
jgi:hypothetical protein